MENLQFYEASFEKIQFTAPEEFLERKSSYLPEILEREKLQLEEVQNFIKSLGISKRPELPTTNQENWIENCKQIRQRDLNKTCPDIKGYM